MKHIKYIIIFTICFIFFAPATSVYAEKIEGWERAFFLQPDDMEAWISADKRRIPLRLEGKLPVGKVHCIFTGAD